MTKLVHKNTYVLHNGERVIMMKIVGSASTSEYPFQAVMESNQTLHCGRYTDDGFWCSTKEFDRRNVNFKEEGMEEITSINLPKIVTELAGGTTFYTERGTKIFFKDNKFYFGDAALNITKLLGCKLGKNVDKEVGKVCRVWDRESAKPIYQFVIKVNKTNTYPYTTDTGAVWKYAEAVVQ